MNGGMRQLGMGFAIAALAAAGLILLSLAIPLEVWRTGELPAPPMQLVEGGPAVALTRRIWIDTDAACGHSRTTDPDDCFALLLLARAKGVRIAGVSSVFGNAPLAITDRTAHELTALLRQEGASIGPLHRGAAQAGDTASAPAVGALREALAEGPLTIVALGPLTNIAAALAGRPDLQRSVARLIVVMGRTPGHLFHPSEGEGDGMLFGHGPVFRDFNLELDPEAAARLLAMELPATLVPYTVARQVRLSGADLERLDAGGGSASWVASRARGWLGYWEEAIGLDGFYPFDLLAAAYALQPALFSCAPVQARVERDRTLWGRFYGPEALLVEELGERDTDTSGEALYCPDSDARVHEWLLLELAGPPAGQGEAPATLGRLRGKTLPQVGDDGV
jgi:inosine-uridine nucleoside N-ribohydrolase